MVTLRMPYKWHPTTETFELIDPLSCQLEHYFGNVCNSDAIQYIDFL